MSLCLTITTAGRGVQCSINCKATLGWGGGKLYLSWWSLWGGRHIKRCSQRMCQSGLWSSLDRWWIWSQISGRWRANERSQHESWSSLNTFIHTVDLMHTTNLSMLSLVWSLLPELNSWAGLRRCPHPLGRSAPQQTQSQAAGTQSWRTWRHEVYQCCFYSN